MRREAEIRGGRAVQGGGAGEWEVAIEAVTVGILCLAHVRLLAQTDCWHRLGRLFASCPLARAQGVGHQRGAADVALTLVTPLTACVQVVLWAQHALMDHLSLASHLWMAVQLAPLLAALVFMALRPAAFLRWRTTLVLTLRLATYLPPNSRTLSGSPRVLQRAAAPGRRGGAADAFRLLLGGCLGCLCCDRRCRRRSSSSHCSRSRHCCCHLIFGEPRPFLPLFCYIVCNDACLGAAGTRVLLVLLAGIVFPLPPALLLVVQLSQAWLTWTPLYCSTQVGGRGWAGQVVGWIGGRW